MRITGHKTEDIYQRYNIVSSADVIDAGQKWARYVEGLASSPTVVPLKSPAQASLDTGTGTEQAQGTGTGQNGHRTGTKSKGPAHHRALTT
jgi:hypothetical protein